MEVLWRDETLFRNESVFDTEYLPDAILHREQQVSSLAFSLKPATKGFRPVDILCIGPPSTGKTSSVRYVLNMLSEFEGVLVAYIRCPVMRTAYNILSRIYEIVCGKMAPQKGLPLWKLFSEVCGELMRRDQTLIAVLDDVNFLDQEALNEIMKVIIKSGDEHGVRIGTILIATEMDFISKLDPLVGSAFHFSEVHFPPYSRNEIRDILEWRVRHGFQNGVLSDEAFESVVDLTSRTGDIRFGLYLLRAAGIEAERRAKRRIEAEDVERVYEGGAKVFLAKSISALNSDEREALKIIYSLETDEITTGEVYAIMRAEVGLYYERFYEIIDKLERLRFIDVVFGRKGRGRTRYIYRRYERELMEKALKECW
jgi:cell division control protein 6